MDIQWLKLERKLSMRNKFNDGKRANKWHTRQANEDKQKNMKSLRWG